MTKVNLGFRVLGSTTGRRRPVNAAAAFLGYANCVPAAKIECEAYLSSFWFGSSFQDYLNAFGTTKGFDGECWSPFIWFDIDREHDLQAALSEARGLVASILERYQELSEDNLLSFFSGAKGFHVGVPCIWRPKPSRVFNQVARRFAEELAVLARAEIDIGVYDKVRLFRAPNSRHPKTGLFKRYLSHDELMNLSYMGILQLAQEAVPFDIALPNATSVQAAQDWASAEKLIYEQLEKRVQRITEKTKGKLNRLVREFIADGTVIGDSVNTGNRHRLLFSIAANLGELGCPLQLTVELLLESALNTGLPRKDALRQIECGHEHGVKQQKQKKENISNGESTLPDRS